MHDEDSGAILLRRFVDEKSHEAFSELVRTQIHFVYSSALRQVSGDVHLAKDVTQTVFVELIRKAPELRRSQSIAGWLFSSTRFAARKALRKQRRWLWRQEAGHRALELNRPDDADAAWTEIRPFLDEALTELGACDRTVILARFFEQCSMAEVARVCGTTENAARMRVDRALERLRLRLEKKGFRSTASILAGSIASAAAERAPTGLANSLSGSALASAALVNAGNTVIAQGLRFLLLGNLKVGETAIALALAGGIVAAVHHYTAHSGMASPRAALRQTQGARQAPDPRRDDASFASTAPRAAAVRAASPPALSDLLKRQMREHVLESVTKLYADFIAAHGLSPEKADLLRELLTDQLMIGTDGSVQLGTGEDATSKAAVEKIWAKNQQLIADLIGENGPQELKDYVSMKSGQDTANGALAAVDPDNQLDPGVRQKALALFSTFDPYQGIGDHFVDMTMIDDAARQRMLAEQGDNIARISSGLGARLTGAQIFAWEQWARAAVNKQIDFVNSGVASSRKSPPSGGGSR